MNSPLLNAICFLTPSSRTEYLLRRLYGFGLSRFGILHRYLKVQGIPAFTESAIHASVSPPDFNNLERPNVQIVRHRLLRAEHHISGAHYSERAVIKPHGGVRDERVEEPRFRLR